MTTLQRTIERLQAQIEKDHHSLFAMHNRLLPCKCYESGYAPEHFADCQACICARYHRNRRALNSSIRALARRNKRDNRSRAGMRIDWMRPQKCDRTDFFNYFSRVGTLVNLHPQHPYGNYTGWLVLEGWPLGDYPDWWIS